jgi:hypothetical protein
MIGVPSSVRSSGYTDFRTELNSRMGATILPLVAECL